MAAVVSATGVRSPSDGILECLERGRVNILRAAIELAGSQVDAVSGSVTISDSFGATQVADASVVVVGGVATYAYAPAATLILGGGWLILWVLTLTSGEVVTIRREAALCRVALRCPIGVNDLYDELSQIDPGHAAPSSGATSAEHDRKIEAAWRTVQARLVAAGRRPHLILDSQALRESMVNLALALILEDSRGAAPQLRELGVARRTAWEQAWQRLQLQYDAGDTGKSQDGAVPGRPGWVALIGLDR